MARTNTRAWQRMLSGRRLDLLAGLLLGELLGLLLGIVHDEPPEANNGHKRQRLTSVVSLYCVMTRSRSMEAVFDEWLWHYPATADMLQKLRLGKNLRVWCEI